MIHQLGFKGAIAAWSLVAVAVPVGLAKIDRELHPPHTCDGAPVHGAVSTAQFSIERQHAAEEQLLRAVTEEQSKRLAALTQKLDQLERFVDEHPGAVEEARALIEAGAAGEMTTQAAQEARDEASLQAAIATDALGRSEEPRKVAAGMVAPPLPPSAFVYVGSCGEDGWRAVNFDNPPPCKAGDIMVLPQYVHGRKITALHDLTLRGSLPTEKQGLGPTLEPYLPAGVTVRLVEIYPMSKLSDPPRLYWAKVEPL